MFYSFLIYLLIFRPEFRLISMLNCSHISLNFTGLSLTCPVATEDVSPELHIWLFILPNESVSLPTDRRHAHFSLKCSWIREQSGLSAEVKEKCLHSLRHLNENSPLVLFPPSHLFSFSDSIYYFQFCLLFFCQHKQSKKHCFENCEAHYFTDNV